MSGGVMGTPGKLMPLGRNANVFWLPCVNAAAVILLTMCQNYVDQLGEAPQRSPLPVSWINGMLCDSKRRACVV